MLNLPTFFSLRNKDIKHCKWYSAQGLEKILTASAPAKNSNNKIQNILKFKLNPEKNVSY